MNYCLRRSSLLICSFLSALFFYTAAAQDDVSTRDRFPRYDYPFFYRDINLFRVNIPKERINALFLPAGQWKPYPQAGDRAAWERIAPALKQQFIQSAEKNKDFAWPALKATYFMEYAQNGNRYHYQEYSFERTTILYQLVMAECIEHKGRFMDAIVNGIWAICEETFWGVPAHLFLQNKGETPLPMKSDPVCDLFAAERAACLAWTYYLLGSELDKMTPMIGQRIYDEVNHRIFESTMNHHDWRWMGLKKDMTRRVNNWAPWISSNWLASVLLLEKDTTRRTLYLHRIFQVLDQFTNTQPEDGACEEGPGYWNRAAASLFECLEMLKSASNGQVDLFDIPMIRHSGSYIYKVDIGHHYFFNYADANPRYAELPANLVYRYGKETNDPQMTAYGAWLMKEQKPDVNSLQQTFLRGLPDIFRLPAYEAETATEPLPRDVWFASNQLMCARSQSGSFKGLFLAIKGNNNMESHNHNDVGGFIVYVDGYPALIDVGKREYTGPNDTNPLREIYKSSAYHNLPLVNGVEQGKGATFEATDVVYKNTGAKASISMNIAKAYPAKAGIRYWNRTMEFIRNKEIRLTESFELSGDKNTIDLHLMTHRKAVVTTPGKMILSDPSGLSGDLVIRYDALVLQPEVQAIPCDDKELRQNWGDTVYRLVFHYRRGKKKDKVTMVFATQ